MREAKDCHSGQTGRHVPALQNERTGFSRNNVQFGGEGGDGSGGVVVGSILVKFADEI